MRLLPKIIRIENDLVIVRVLVVLLMIKVFIIDFTLAQDLRFSHITSEDGLSNNTVHCVYQDSRGFLWFGTEDGVNLYNGYEFTVFEYDSQDTNRLSGNSVFGIIEDAKGRLWIAGSSGVDIFNRENISFEHVSIVDEINTTSYDGYTRAITTDQDGNIVIANNTGIFVFDSLKGGFIRFSKNDPIISTLQYEDIRSVLIDRNQRVWIGSLGYGLYCYDLRRNELVDVQNLKGGINIKEKTYSIAEDLNGNILIGTDNGLYIVKEDLSEILHMTEASGLSSNNIRYIFIEDENRIWIGTDGGGLCLYDRISDNITCHTFDEYNDYSLSNNSIRSVWKDEQDILWVGTFQGGINFAPLSGGLKFKKISRIIGKRNSLSFNTVSAIFEDTDGNLWVGTDGGGLNYYHTQSKTFRHYISKPGSSNTINGNSILAIAQDSKGNIWAGGYLQGVDVINRTTGEIRNYKHNPDNQNSLSNDDVRDILIDGDSVLWIATNGGGLNRLDLKTNKFTHFGGTSANASVNNWCIKLFKDSHDLLWIGTYRGLSIYDLKNNQFKSYSFENSSGRLNNRWVYSFAEDNSGNVWIGTANGLNYFNREKQVFTTTFSSELLPNAVINGILIDSDENLWLSTNNGITKFNPSDTSFKNYDVYDGLQGTQFIHGSYLKTKDGEMYFGGLNGLNHFYPDSIKDNQFKPKVYLTDFLVFFEPANVNAKGSPLFKSITESEEIILSHQHSVITFKYAALNFFNTKKNKYKYILEGFEKEWNNVGTRREATYTNLNPGKYTFKVMASNNDGLWNEIEASIRVVVLPPWWKTLFFRILVVLLITSLIIGYYFIRINSLKVRQVQLEELVKKRTKEIKEKNNELANQTEELSEYNTLLEERQQMIEEQTEELVAQKEQLVHANMNLEELNLTKDKFFSIIAHDLKNPFNTILGFSELLVKRYDTLSEEKRRSFSKAIYESSENVYNLLENLLMWARSQTNSLKFDPVSFNMNILVEENIELLKEMFKKKNINLAFESTDIHDVYADRNMINTVIRNLLTNAAKFTNENGKVEVELANKNNEIVLQVSDSGIGISEEEQAKLFRIDGQVLRDGTGGELGTGLGLLLCKEYIEKNNGRIWLESKVDEGSIFYFALPINSQN